MSRVLEQEGAMYYKDYTIDMTLTEMRDKAVMNSTPKKFARPLLEGAEIIKQLRKERDEARAKEPKWIPVTERLPTGDLRVLALANDGWVFIAPGFSFGDEINDEPNGVRAWMPLPGKEDNDAENEA